MFLKVIYWIALLLLHLAFSFCFAYNLNGVLSDSELPNFNGNDDEDISVSSTTPSIKARRGRFLRRNPLPVYHTETPLSDEIMENFEMLRRNDKTKRKYVVEVPVPVPSEEEDSKASLSEIHYAPSSDTPTSTYIPDIQFFQYEDIQQLVNKNAQNGEEKPETNKETKKIIQYRPRYNLESPSQSTEPWESGKVNDNINKKKETENYMSDMMDSNKYKEEKEAQMKEIKNKPKYYNYQDEYDTKYYYPHQKKMKPYVEEEIGNKYTETEKVVSRKPESDQMTERKPRQRYQNVQKHTSVIHDTTKLKDEQYLESFPNEGRKIKENYTQKQYKFINDLINTPDGKQQNNFRIVIDNSTNNDEEVRPYRYKPMSEEKIVEYVKTHYPKDKIAQSVIVISNDDDNKFITHYKPVRKYNKKHNQEKSTTPHPDSEVSESAIQEEKLKHLRDNQIKEGEGITVEPYSTRGQVQDVGKKSKEAKDQHHIKEPITENPEVVRIGHQNSLNKQQQFQLQEYPYEILKEKAPGKQGQNYKLQEYAYDVRDQNYEIRIKSKPSKEMKSLEHSTISEDKFGMKYTEHTTKTPEIPKMHSYIHLQNQNQDPIKEEPKDSYEVSEMTVDKKPTQKVEKETQRDLNQLKVGLGGYWKDLGPVKLKAAHQQQETKPDDSKQPETLIKTEDGAKAHYFNQLKQPFLIDQPEHKLPSTNKIPEQLILYKIQQGKPNLPYPELNVLFSPNNHQQIKLPQLNNEEDSKPKLKLVDPHLVYLPQGGFPQQHQNPPQLNLQQHELPQFNLLQHKLPQQNLLQLNLQQHQLPQLDLHQLPQFDLQKLHGLPHYNLHQQNLQQPQHDLLQQALPQLHDLPQTNLDQKIPEDDLKGITYRPKHLIRYTDADNLFKNDQKEQQTKQPDLSEENKSEVKYPDNDFMYKFKPTQEEKKILEQDDTREKIPEFTLYKQPNQSKKTINDYVVHSTSKNHPSDFIAPTTVHPTLQNIKFSSSHYEPSEKIKRGPYKLIFPQKT